MNNKEIEILLVEDNPDDAMLTLRALEKHKLANRVCHVKDGVEALDFLFGRGDYKKRNLLNTPKVVFLDLKLPKIGGLEVLAEMRKNDLTKLIPVVVLTSSKEDQDVIDSYKLGVNSYIVKPVDFEKFMNSVSELGFYWLLLNEPPIR
jgi:CheY-like chemotaxis protein